MMKLERKAKIYRFVNDNFSKLVIGCVAIMTVCVFAITINTTRYITELKMQDEIKAKQEQTMAEMQIQTEIMLNENGFEWNGTQVVALPTVLRDNE